MSISQNSQNLVLDTKRHSFAHLMAASVKDMFPEAQFGVGPVIENGCYYDFILPRTLIPEDLPLIEAKMKEMLKMHLAYKVQEVGIEEAIELFEKNGQPLKVELLNDLRTRGTTSMSEEERADFESSKMDLSENSAFYKELDQKAKDINKQVVVELIITNSKGEVFAQRRSSTRKLYPGCWNLVGGHVENGDNIFNTIIKELKEETDWDLENVAKYLGNFIWTPEKDGTDLNKISYYFEVKVKDGEPKLEEGKADKFEWINDNNLDLLLENEDIGGDYVYKIVKKHLEKDVNRVNLPTITIYRIVNESTGQIVFEDLCKGPHVEHVKEMKSIGFALDKFSASYWRGDQERDIRMQRLYALVFETKEELLEFQTMREEALKYDHRLLGQQLDLFYFSDLVGPGLPLYTAKGTLIKNKLKELLLQVSRKYGVQEVSIPHFANKKLYEISGHAAKFSGELFGVTDHYGNDFVLKPVNCPHHTQIYAGKPRSYRDLPMRFVESTMQYRDEKPGSIGGLTRTRGFTVDDGHTFCRVDQIKDEVVNTLNVIRDFYTSFGLWGKQWVSISVRDYNHPENYTGFPEDWDKAEQMLKDISIENNLEGKVNEGEAALYGPKLDFMYVDAQGKERQLATVQIDFATPKRFELVYTNEEGGDSTPVMLHRAILGSYERFVAILLESSKGRLPLWLAPTQVKILTINTQPEILEYVEKVKSILSEVVLMKPLKYNEIRFEVDDRSESLGKKIREAEMQKIPVMIIVGPKDITENQVSVRTQEGESKVGLEELEEYLKGI